MINQPWLRYVEILVGPLAEWQGGGDEQKAIKIVSDGTNNSLRVSFSIHKHIISTARPSTIDIYNLSDGLRRAFRRDQQIIIRVGWSNTEIVSLCKGGLLSAVSQRSGVDIVTTLSFIAGYGGLERNIVSTKWSGGTSLKNVIQFVAGGLEGVVVDPKLIQVKEVTIPPRGLSFSGLSSEILDGLARTYGFSWTINDGVFQALSDSKTFSGGTVKVGSENGLMRAEPMLRGVFQQQAGVTLQTLLNPAIQPGKGVELKGQMNPGLNGIHKVASLSHTGDTNSNQWTTSLEAWTVETWGT